MPKKIIKPYEVGKKYSSPYGTLEDREWECLRVFPDGDGVFLHPESFKTVYKPGFLKEIRELRSISYCTFIVTDETKKLNIVSFPSEPRSHLQSYEDNVKRSGYTILDKKFTTWKEKE